MNDDLISHSTIVKHLVEITEGVTQRTYNQDVLLVHIEILSELIDTRHEQQEKIKSKIFDTLKKI